MKGLLLILLIITGCSTAKVYRADDVSKNLLKHSQQLQVITYQVENDYSAKLALYEKFRLQRDDLDWRINDLKLKRDSILNKSVMVNQSNAKLMDKLAKKKLVEEADPIFSKIDSFTTYSTKEAGQLCNEYDSYTKASAEFARFLSFTAGVD